MSNDLIRVAIFTDTHLGYLERDPALNQEPYDVFEEAMEQADFENCDLVIHSGDLFDNSNPSRYATLRAMEILEKYVKGDKREPPKCSSYEGLKYEPNWENPYTKIQLPFFVIHGNHDNPSGLDSTAAVEILDRAKLCNMFKVPDRTRDVITLEPVVVCRGSVRLVVYGLGAINENEFTTKLQEKKIALQPVPVEPQYFTYTILLIHQNRNKYTGNSVNNVRLLSDCLKDSPQTVNLVVWGHEHENRISREDYEMFKLTQPGSTICTKLTKTDATDRSMAILEIRGDGTDDFCIKKLEKARPYLYETLELAKELQGKNSDKARLDVIRNKLNEMLEQYLEDGIKPRIRLELVTDGVDMDSLKYKKIIPEYHDRIVDAEHMFKLTKAKKKVSGEAGEERKVPTEHVDSIEDVLLEKVDDKTFGLLTIRVLSQSLAEFVRSTDKGAFADTLSGVVNESLQILNSSLEQEQSQDQPMSPERAMSFIAEHREMLVKALDRRLPTRSPAPSPKRPRRSEPSHQPPPEEEEAKTAEEPEPIIDDTSRPKRRTRKRN